LGAATIEEDERVWMAMGAANRDPEVFPNPDELNLERSPNRHVAFGVGMHRCIGSHMAMAMFEIVTEQALRRMPDLKIDRDRSRRYQSTGVLNGWAEIWGTFTPGDRRGRTLTE
jgi:cytochrome P450